MHDEAIIYKRYYVIFIKPQICFLYHFAKTAFIDNLSLQVNLCFIDFQAFFILFSNIFKALSIFHLSSYLVPHSSCVDTFFFGVDEHIVVVISYDLHLMNRTLLTFCLKQKFSWEWSVHFWSMKFVFLLGILSFNNTNFWFIRLYVKNAENMYLINCGYCQ